MSVVTYPNEELTHNFLNITKHGFFRVAVISPRVHLGNPMACADEHNAMIKSMVEQGAQYILAPELGLSGGYSLGDLHHSDVMRDASQNALLKVLSANEYNNVIITVGAAIQVNNDLLNCAVTILNGKILAITPKEYLPNEGEFYEERHWATSGQITSDVVGFPDELLDSQKKIPIGDSILIRCNAHPGVVIYPTVCESDWVAAPTSAFAVLAGATIVANVSASNVTIGKDEYREALFGSASGRYNCAYLYSSAGFGESTSDHSWDGHLFVAERGSVVARGERYSQHGSSVIHDVDIRMLEKDRIRQHSFRANAAKYRDILKAMVMVDVPESLGADNDTSNLALETPLANVSTTPFIPINDEQRKKRCQEVFNQQSSSLQRRIMRMSEKNRKITIGISGGSDSTHALNIAVHAMDQLGLPRNNITTVSLPGYGTSKRTKDNAFALCNAYRVAFSELRIQDICNVMFETIDFTYDQNATQQAVVFENVQAWSRTQVLLALASKNGGFVLGTGDMSELAQGWCTLFGDHPLHYGINSGVAKTLILYLIGYAKDEVFKAEPKVQEVLLSVLETDISPELLPLKEGEIAQKTEELIGPYILTDFFLYYLVRFGFTPTRILRLAVHAFDGKYSYAEIRSWLRKFLVRFFGAQFKRNIASDGPKIGLVSLNPRGDWRMPADVEVTAWLEDLDNTPKTLE